MNNNKSEVSSQKYILTHKRELLDKFLWLFVVSCVVVSAVELYIGVITESLAAFADVVHKMETISSFMIIVIGNILQKRSADNQYSYGYGRHEYLFVFTLSLSVIIICGFLLIEILHQVSNNHHFYRESVAPEILKYSNYVNYASFALSLIAIFGFRYYKQQFNVRYSNDVFKAKSTASRGIDGEDVVHIFIDLLALVSMIISDYLNMQQNMIYASLIECLLLSVFMIFTSWPKLMVSAEVLTMGITDELSQEIRTLLRRISMLDGVVEVKSAKYWVESPGNLVGMINVEAHRTANKKQLMSMIQSMCSNTFQDVVIQVDQNPLIEWMD